MVKYFIICTWNTTIGDPAKLSRDCEIHKLNDLTPETYQVISAIENQNMVTGYN
jgi:hypothetical protein